MKIVHIITGLNNGGAESVLTRLASHDQAAGNRHTVISLMDQGLYGPRLEQAGVDVHCLAMPRGRLTLAGLIRLYRLLRRLQPDVVQTWMYHADLIGGVMARLAGLRHICWGIRHSNLEPGTISTTTLLTARLCARLSGVVPARIVSCSLKATAVHQALGYRADKFVTIPNGYDTSRLQPDAAARIAFRRELGVADSSCLLGMVARFDPQKDHTNLIQALRLLKAAGHDFRCVLAGVGMSADNPALMAQVQAAQLEQQVILLGPRQDIPALMNGLDLHVLSSLGEAFPNVLAEAMACGTPCVSTDVGDAALIIGETGWVVPPRSPQALASALAAALGSRAAGTWPTRQQACRERIQANFSLERMLESYRSAWLQLHDQPRQIGARP